MSECVERLGEVVAVENGVAKVRLEVAAACGGCGSRGSCASGGAAERVIEMHVSDHTRLGDRLAVSLPATALTLAALLGYLLPPLSLLAGAIVGALAFGGDLPAVLGALLGLSAGLLMVRLISAATPALHLVSSLRDVRSQTDFQTGDQS